jgi:hypothetical protein
MTLEELAEHERAEISLRATDPLISIHANIRRSERAAIDRYCTARSIIFSDGLRELIRDGLVRWEREETHGRK